MMDSNSVIGKTVAVVNTGIVGKVSEVVTRSSGEIIFVIKIDDTVTWRIPADLVNFTEGAKHDSRN